MGGRFSELAQYLLDHSSMEASSVEEIQSLVDKYPYFAPARFLLVEQLKTVDPEAYAHQLSKAILYYHNPLEFQFLIDAGRFHTSLHLPEEESRPEAEAADEQTNTSFVQEDFAERPEAVFITKEVEVTEPVVEPPEEENKITEPEEVSAPEIEVSGPVLSEPVSLAEQEDRIEETVVAASNHLPAAQAPTANTDLAFEPFHTVDYFASQGIKLSTEDTGKDKFGKQLRSFTEWLKTMKRLPPAALQSQTETPSEHKVKDMAEDSIHQSEVYTETMAEVWTKQGNYARAAEVYHKLSLIHPSKKAYFAAKIENLKRN